MRSHQHAGRSMADRRARLEGIYDANSQLILA